MLKTNTLFAAIADPIRRQVLERLRQEGPLSLSELSAPLSISRQAVTKHLNQLSGAGLISIERHGRERRHRLQAAPLQAVDDWLKPYATAWDNALQRLRRHLNEPDHEEHTDEHCR